MSVYGARFNDRCAAQWAYGDAHPQDRLSEIPCVLGAGYAMQREYYLRLHGLNGLRSYGSDEELLSLKVWAEGGRCLLVKDWQVGHLYRKSAPYANPTPDTTYNQMLIQELFFTGEEKAQYLNRQSEKKPPEALAKAVAMVAAKGAWIDKERKYLWGIFVENARDIIASITRQGQ
jgi:hypothetical protein